MYLLSGHIQLTLSDFIFIVNKTVATLVDYTILFQYGSQNYHLP